ncbi:hypothetical protein BT69DRAFT_1334723 [Atractiella rhizophila]|nr:hypothetical protein BT69DRAFT_1334723 [Atractiella rhizophila]
MEQLLQLDLDLDAEWLKWREYLTQPLTEEEIEDMDEGNPNLSEYCPSCGAKPGSPGDLCPALRLHPPFSSKSDSWVQGITELVRAGSYPIFQKRLLPLDHNISLHPKDHATWYSWGRYSIFSRLRQAFNLPLPNTVPRTIPYTWYDGDHLGSYGVVCFLYGCDFYEWHPDSRDIFKIGPARGTDFYKAFQQPPERDETAHLNRRERRMMGIKKKKRKPKLRAPVVMVKTVVADEMLAFSRLPLELVDEILFFLKPLPFSFDSDFDAKAADNLGRRHGLASFIRSAKRFVDIGRRHLYETPWLKGWYQWEDQNDEVLFLQTLKRSPHLRNLVRNISYDLAIGLHGGLASLSRILQEAKHIISLSLQGLTSNACVYIMMHSASLYSHLSSLKLHGVPDQRLLKISHSLDYLSRFRSLRELELRYAHFEPSFEDLPNATTTDYYLEKPDFRLQALAVYDSRIGPDFVPILEGSLPTLHTLILEGVECECDKTMSILRNLTEESLWGHFFRYD